MQKNSCYSVYIVSFIVHMPAVHAIGCVYMHNISSMPLRRIIKRIQTLKSTRHTFFLSSQGENVAAGAAICDTEDTTCEISIPRCLPEGQEVLVQGKTALSRIIARAVWMS